MATQEFLDAFRSGGVDLRHLLLLVVPRNDDLASDTLYLSDSEIGTLGGVVPGVGSGHLWQSAVKDFGPISCPGAFCGTSIALAGAAVTLNADKQIILSSSATASTLRNMLQTHVMTNASATIYRMIPQLGAANDAQLLGEYRVISFELDGSDLRLQLRQRTEWNKAIAPRYVNKQEYPRSPDEAAGIGLPLAYGNVSGLGLRRPWPSAFGADYRWLDMVRAPRRSVGAVLVDSGRGAGAAQNPSAKVVMAGHACESVVDTSLGTMLYMKSKNVDRLLVIDAPGGNVFNTSTEAGVLLPDQFGFAWIGNIPGEVYNPTSGALNPRHILSPSDATYSYLDYAAGLRNLEFRWSPNEKIGFGVTYQYIVGYQSTANLASLGLYLGVNPAIDDWALRLALPASTAPTVLATNTFALADADPWDFFSQYQFRVMFRGGTPAGQAKVFFVGWVIKFKPYEATVVTERFVGRYRTVQRSVKVPFIRRPLFYPYQEPALEPAVTELEGSFFCNVRGHKDDGSGTYTGTASTLIERLPDIIRHLLVTYGAESPANIEAGESAIGSFVSARAVLIDERGATLRYAMSIGISTDMTAAIAQLGASGLAMPHISPYDNKWKIIVWRAAPPITYPWQFSRWDVVDAMGPKVEHTPLPELLTGVRVAYGYNGFTRSYDSEVALSHNRSVAGYEYFGLRDQLLTVTASVNDRLNFKETWSGATIYTMTLTAGDYATPHLLAKHITARMRVAAPNDHLVSVCNVIEEGYNDRLKYTDPTARFVGIKPGTYTTMEALRSEAQRALNQTGTITGCSWTAPSPVITPSNPAVLDFLAVGQPVSGTGIGGGSVVTSITATYFTVSVLTTASGSNATLTASFVASWASPSVTITLANPAHAAKFTRGMRLVGTGISATALITTVNDAAGTITIDTSTTAAGNNANIQTLSSTGSQWLLRYTGGKFGVSKTAGTLTVPGYVVSANAARLDNAWGVLGFSRILADVTVPTTPTYTDANDVRFEDHLCLISLESTTDLLLSTGADGQDSATAVRHCGDLLGVSGESDLLQSLDAPHGTTCFFTPKGNREIALRKTAARYGARRDVEIEGRAIYDTRTALSLRNRIADLLGKPRTIITFNTTKAPDIERGDVFEFRADMDDFLPYPGLGSDGLWTGKRFIVTDVTHHLGPSSRDTTIVAVDVTD